MVIASFVQEEELAAAAAVVAALTRCRGMGGHVRGEQIDQERRKANGAEVVRVVVAERAVLGRLEDKGPVRRAELDFDPDFGVANVVGPQPKQLTPRKPHQEQTIHMTKSSSRPVRMARRPASSNACSGVTRAGSRRAACARR